jgi:hypothetical protein
MGLEDCETVTCNDCGDSYRTSYSSLGGKKCYECGSKNVSIVKYDEYTNPSDIIETIESELESANYHSMISIARDLYEKLKDKVESPIDLSRTIAEVLYSAI